jgi:hypothetical protein
MAFLWTPDPSEPLFEGLETTIDLALSISVSADETDATATEPKITVWSLSGTESLIGKAQATLSDTELILFLEDLNGAIPIISIEYCYPNSTLVNRVSDWDSLPSEPIQIIRYQKSSDSPKTLSISVTAEDSDGISETAVYSIVVQGEYSSGRDRLLAALTRN